MFSCEVCEIFKKTYFTQHLQTTASVDTKNSFKTEQKTHQVMLFVICDLPISDVSCEITWKFTKILEGTSEGVAGLQLAILLKYC